MDGTPLYCWWRNRFHRRSVAVLMYHAVWPDALPFENRCFVRERDFRSQVAFLAEHADVLTPAVAHDRFRGGAMEKPAVVITFDDGYQNNADVAFPVLAEYDLPATVFLATRFLSSSYTMWDSRLHWGMCRTDHAVATWDGTDYPLTDPETRAASFRDLCDRLRRLHPREIDREVSRLLTSLDVDASEALPPDSPYRMLDRDSARRLAESGLVTFGAHTESHAILSRLSPEEQHVEITRSLNDVAALTGESCRLFAYPNGQPGDYDTTGIEVLRRGGVELAFTTVDGPWMDEGSHLEVPRYGIGSGLGQDAFRRRVFHATRTGLRRWKAMVGRAD